MRVSDLIKRGVPDWATARKRAKDNGEDAERASGSSGLVSLEYEWINNEQLLREEGAVYGMLGQGMDEKLEVIQHYFDRITATVRVQLLSEESALEDLRLRETTIREKLTATEAELDAFPAPPDRTAHHFWRSLVGLVVYLLIFGTTPYHAYVWLLPELGASAIWVTLGVFSFGSLSLFSHFPFLLNPDRRVREADQRENWKVILEEIGIPLVAVIFIISFGAPHHPWWHSIALAPLLLFVFMFTGKGLLASITSIVPQWQAFQTNRNREATYRRDRSTLEATLAKAEENIREIAQAISEKRQRIADLQRELSEAGQESETRKSYFISEFKLAANTRS